jgi:hypothetical protein
VTQKIKKRLIGNNRGLGIIGDRLKNFAKEEQIDNFNCWNIFCWEAKNHDNAFNSKIAKMFGDTGNIANKSDRNDGPMIVFDYYFANACIPG